MGYERGLLSGWTRLAVRGVLPALNPSALSLSRPLLALARSPLALARPLLALALPALALALPALALDRPPLALAPPALALNLSALALVHPRTADLNLLEPGGTSCAPRGDDPGNHPGHQCRSDH